MKTSFRRGAGKTERERSEWETGESSLLPSVCLAASCFRSVRLSPADCQHCHNCNS